MVKKSNDLKRSVYSVDMDTILKDKLIPTKKQFFSDFFPLVLLPNDVLHYIFTMLPEKELADVGSTCKLFHSLSDAAFHTLFVSIFCHAPINVSRRLSIKAVRKYYSGKTKDIQDIFLWAVSMGYYAFVQKCIDNGIVGRFKGGINTTKEKDDDKTALHLAIGSGHIPVLKLLLKNKANPLIHTRQKMNGLHVAAENGQIDSMKLILEHKFYSLDAIDEHGRSALMIASENEQLESVIFLLSQGANVNLTNKEGKTSLHLAAQKNFIDILKVLIGAKADIDMQTETGKTPVYIAAESGHGEAISLLLECGANIRQPSFRQKIPLYAAAELGHADAVRALLPFSRESDVFFLSTYGTTPMFIANKHPNKSVKKLLSQFIMDHRPKNVSNRRKSARPKTPRFAEEIDIFTNYSNTKKAFTIPIEFESSYLPPIISPTIEKQDLDEEIGNINDIDEISPFYYSKSFENLNIEHELSSLGQKWATNRISTSSYSKKRIPNSSLLKTQNDSNKHTSSLKNATRSVFSKGIDYSASTQHTKQPSDFAATMSSPKQTNLSERKSPDFVATISSPINDYKINNSQIPLALSSHFKATEVKPTLAPKSLLKSSTKSSLSISKSKTPPESFRSTVSKPSLFISETMKPKSSGSLVSRLSSKRPNFMQPKPSRSSKQSILKSETPPFIHPRSSSSHNPQASNSSSYLLPSHQPPLFNHPKPPSFISSTPTIVNQRPNIFPSSSEGAARASSSSVPFPHYSSSIARSSISKNAYSFSNRSTYTEKTEKRDLYATIRHAREVAKQISMSKGLNRPSSDKNQGSVSVTGIQKQARNILSQSLSKSATAHKSSLDIRVQQLLSTISKNVNANHASIPKTTFFSHE